MLVQYSFYFYVYSYIVVYVSYIFLNTNVLGLLLASGTNWGEEGQAIFRKVGTDPVTTINLTQYSTSTEKKLNIGIKKLVVFQQLRSVETAGKS